ncbi:hypothetical protein [Sphingomonas panaciterrae]|uniref:hypothetical protein n=1 Tax=Sphingomonas panaciterrae TaxID=1462999 RepID=UPI002FF38D81
METPPTTAARIFKEERVEISNRRFVDCTFINCRLVFDGGPIALDGCDTSHCQWEFTGAAATTVEMIASAWAAGMRAMPCQVMGAITGMQPQDVLQCLTGSNELPNEAPR